MDEGGVFLPAGFGPDVYLQAKRQIAVVRSPHILGTVDYSALRHARSDIVILTSRDIPGSKCIGRFSQDQPILADNDARYTGEPVALLITTKAEDIAELHHTLETNSVVPHPAADAEMVVETLARIQQGNVDAALRRADAVARHTYKLPQLAHGFLEPEAGVASWESDQLVIHYPTQAPHAAREVISQMLRIPRSKVRVAPTRIGGAFGGKLDLTPLCWLALAAYHTRDTVGIRYSPTESLAYGVKSHGIEAEVATGAAASGDLLGVRARIILSAGVYRSYTPGVAQRIAIHAAGPYNIPNLDVTVQVRKGSGAPAGAMRGFGVSKIAVVHELQVERLAEQLSLDSLAMRRQNALKVGDCTSTGQTLDDRVQLRECLEVASSIRASWRQEPRSAHTHLLRGIGVSAFMYGIGATGHANPARATIELSPVGDVICRVGTINMGQRPSRMLRSIVAKELHSLPSLVRVILGDTSQTPDSGATSASRTAHYVGNAVQAAARQFAEKIAEGRTASATLEESELLELFRAHGPLTTTAEYDGDTTPIDIHGKGRPYAAYAFGVAVAEVEVDRETGACRVRRYTGIHDSGQIEDMPNAVAQVHGGCVMGIGAALLERYPYPFPNSTRSFGYSIPSSSDAPADIEVIFLPPVATGGSDRRGLGEPAVVPATAVVAAAFADATGIFPTEFPINRMEYWRELRQEGSQLCES